MENNDRLKDSIKTKIAISEFKRENMAMKKKKNYAVKTIVAACAGLVLTSGIVFAEDIEKIVKNLFSNSNEAINQAVENGYVQKVEEHFVYDKDIGIKVDNLVIDELSLNVSFEFEAKNENIKLVRFNKFIISTDTGEKIYDSDQQYETSIENVYTAQTVTWNKQPQKVADNIFTDSILFTLGERSREKNELYFKIQSVDITYQDDTKEELYGEWNFDVKITEEMRKSQSIKYKLQEPNENVENCTATLSPTGLKVEIILKEVLNTNQFLYENADKVHGSMFFYYKEGEEFIYPAFVSGSQTKFSMNYDNISSLSEIPEKIEIYLDPFWSSIFLVKE